MGLSASCAGWTVPFAARVFLPWSPGWRRRSRVLQDRLSEAWPQGRAVTSQPPAKPGFRTAPRHANCPGMVALSVLDLSPVTTGGSGAVSLRNSIDLARLADRLGYTRYWVAEHHNLPSVASSAPDIMIGQIAAATERMRVGSGGIMLPNHAPLMVAERFKVLEALFPGRIDLGLGRAPGTDPVTSYALRVRQDPRVGDEFLERFQELLLLEHGSFPDGHPFRNVDMAAWLERL